MKQNIYFHTTFPRDTLSLTLTHLQNLLQYLKGNALFEGSAARLSSVVSDKHCIIYTLFFSAADGAVAKALCKLFSADKYYRER